jgi:hypothetical protein
MYKQFHLIFILFTFIQSSFSPQLVAQVLVNGYFKKNGTYVEPYYRTSPNYTIFDNYSTKGNVNPFTGKPGWIDPYSKINGTYKEVYISNYQFDFDKLFQSLTDRDSLKYFNLINYFDTDYKTLSIGIYKLYNSEYVEADKLFRKILRDKKTSQSLKSEVQYWLDLTSYYINTEIEYRQLVNISNDFEKNQDFESLNSKLNGVTYPLNFSYKYLVKFDAAWKSHYYNDALKSLDSLIKYLPKNEIKDSLIVNYSYIVDNLRNMQKTVDAGVKNVRIYSLERLVDNLKYYYDKNTLPAESLEACLFDKSLVIENAFDRHLNDTSRFNNLCAKVEQISFDRYLISKQSDSILLVQIIFFDDISYDNYFEELSKVKKTQALDQSLINYKSIKRSKAQGMEYLLAPYLFCGLTKEKIDDSVSRCIKFRYNLYCYILVDKNRRLLDFSKPL